MYPGPDDPDLGAFVQGIERALADRGHEIERAVLAGAAAASVGTCASRGDRAGPRGDFEPDVVYAHFLVPTGLSAASPRGRRSSSPLTGATSATSAPTRESRPQRDSSSAAPRR